ncbi:hypothetical protein GCM10008025_22030 [Ornithinibacillus halotolerans]|uniref:Uncharacterized protein n=1 Tax=Ornithinibacillus halotolerans TaxID=1274357 RepID=A0A916S245_9BACI|nr:hypothetical protein GCM10008025_22030 [Ornithinibacillus halotolerans]
MKVPKVVIRVENAEELAEREAVTVENPEEMSRISRERGCHGRKLRRDGKN